MALPYDPPLADDKVDSLEFTAMRIHELALLRWLNKAFIFKEGYPVPVIFSTPRDAHADFLRLWKADNNPYRYLTELKDSAGRQVFQPYPANVVYPLLSVTRLNWRLRPAQSCGVRINRQVYYPTTNGVQPTDATVAGSGTITRDDLAWAARSSMPVGWDFRFQIDHYCNTPQTQSVFVNRVMQKFRHTGGSAQTFIVAKYPFPQKKQYVRMFLESDIENVSNDAVNDENQEIRTSFTITIEGFWFDYYTEFNPVMWYLGLGKEKATVPPSELDRWFDFNDIYPGMEDVRVEANNPVIESRSGLPPSSAV